MLPKEKVIRRIEKQIEHCKEVDSDWISLTVETGRSILALIGEREPVAAEIEGGGNGFGSWWYVCGECHGTIDRNDKYCRHCGRGLLWDA